MGRTCFLPQSAAALERPLAVQKSYRQLSYCLYDINKASVLLICAKLLAK